MVVVIEPRAAASEYTGKRVKHRRVAVRIPLSLWSRVKEVQQTRPRSSITDLIVVALSDFVDWHIRKPMNGNADRLIDGAPSPWEPDKENGDLDEVEEVPETPPEAVPVPKEPEKKPEPERRPHAPKNPKAPKTKKKSPREKIGLAKVSRGNGRKGVKK